METFNRNEKQHNFNQVKGVLTELNDGDKFCNITLLIGHERQRYVNLIVKKAEFENIAQDFKEGDRVSVKFYLSSRNNSGRWATMANVLEVIKDK